MVHTLLGGGRVDQFSAVAERHGVTAIPTVLIIKDSKEANRLVGLQPKAKYVTSLDKLVSKGQN